MVAAGGTTLVFNHQKALQNKAQDTANQGDELFDFKNNGSDEDTDTASSTAGYKQVNDKLFFLISLRL